MSFAPPPIALPDEAATTAFAAGMAAHLRPGDTLLLEGPVGSGKTAFSRALIRARLGAPHEDVPSPTFTLVQTYPHDKGDIWHADLYRLGHPDDCIELGLDEAFHSAICLIEWPDRLGRYVPPGALKIAFAAGDHGHQAVLTGPAVWTNRLHSFLTAFGHD